MITAEGYVRFFGNDNEVLGLKHTFLCLSTRMYELY